MTKTTGNIWDALIDDPAERESCKIKSELMMLIEQYIARNKLTQQQAAAVMGTTQPKISNIVNGNIDKITIDLLIEMLSKVDIGFDLVPRVHHAGYGKASRPPSVTL